MTATDTSPVSVASYFVNMYFSECLLMKRLISTIATVLFCICSFAQSEHLTFKGVPIDGTLDTYVENMKKAGFEYIGKEDGIAILQGDFAGFRKCTIGVITLQSFDLVNRITVLFDTTESWSDLYGSYSQLKEMLTRKYGEPEASEEKWIGYSEPKNDRDKMYELRQDRGVINTLFRTDKGNIVLEIIKAEWSGGQVRLSYWDKINSLKVEEKAMDDL